MTLTKIESREGVRITYDVNKDNESIGTLYQPQGGRWWFICNTLGNVSLWQFKTKREALAWMGVEA